MTAPCDWWEAHDVIERRGERPLHLASCWCWRDAAADAAVVTGGRVSWWAAMFGIRSWGCRVH